MHLYNEDHLVEHPAILLLEELDWQFILGLDETFGPDGKLGRETPSDVVLVPRLISALQKLNPNMSPEGVRAAVDELVRDRSAMTEAAANEDVYKLLKGGVAVQVADREHGGQKTERVTVIDWENPEANDFLVVNQFTITGTLYTRRPDLPTDQPHGAAGQYPARTDFWVGVRGRSGRHCARRRLCARLSIASGRAGFGRAVLVDDSARTIFQWPI